MANSQNEIQFLKDKMPSIKQRMRTEIESALKPFDRRKVHYEIDGELGFNVIRIIKYDYPQASSTLKVFPGDMRVNFTIRRQTSEKDESTEEPHGITIDVNENIIHFAYEGALLSLSELVRMMMRPIIEAMSQDPSISSSVQI